MVGHFEARWLLVPGGPGGYRAYDAQADAFVEPTVFEAAVAGEPLTEEQLAAEAAYREGYRALRDKRYDVARAQLTECVAKNPEHAGCHWELGWVPWVAEEWAGAAAAWGEVEKRSPDWPELKQWLPKARAKAPAEPSPAE